MARTILKAAGIKPAYNIKEPSPLHVEWHRMRDKLIEEVGDDAFRFISAYANLSSPGTFIVSTTTLFNISYNATNRSNAIVNLMRINDIRRINKFFEAVNHKLENRGIFIGCAETKQQRKKRILRKYPSVINIIMYFFDYLIKRVFPKFSLTKKIYFFLTRGNNRVLTRAEVLGRLYSCGFEVLEEKFIEDKFYFAVKKAGLPCYDLNPTYGPLVRLRRMGKKGKYIKVYKFRTMHPYAEYLQEYVYRNNNLKDGGKFDNDFRISTVGKFMRTFWIDELPMIINVLKGEMKIVGVRPLSQHYFGLYPEELRAKRVKYKPGLIPPYYVHLPNTLEEIVASELKYLEDFEKHPLWTQWRYFWKALYNILIRKARSS
jgi:lipopolysaccharide/colanic/teichoic acid biosynthesis glycosyltransferase